MQGILLLRLPLSPMDAPGLPVRKGPELKGEVLKHLFRLRQAPLDCYGDGHHDQIWLLLSDSAARVRGELRRSI
jgi:hypothetical protein